MESKDRTRQAGEQLEPKDRDPVSNRLPSAFISAD